MVGKSDNRPVALVGAMNVDLVARAKKFPRPGETVIGDTFYRGYGGKGANQAVTVARMGVPVELIGRVGDDSFGAEMIEHLKAQGVDTTNMGVVEDCPSGTAMIFVDAEAQNEIVVIQGANDRLNAADITEAEDTIAGASLVVVVFDIPPETIKEALRLAAKHGVPTIVNPAPSLPAGTDMSFLEGVDLLVLNETEAEALTGVSVDAPDFAEKAIAALREIGAKTCILTLGENGALFADADGMWQTPAFEVDSVVDTTAAGDAFIGGLAAGYRYFADTRALTRFASAVAALAITKKGAMASLPSRRAVRDFLAQNAPELSKAFEEMGG